MQKALETSIRGGFARICLLFMAIRPAQQF
jgi:hypothetical protein